MLILIMARMTGNTSKENKFMIFKLLMTLILCLLVAKILVNSAILVSKLTEIILKYTQLAKKIKHISLLMTYLKLSMMMEVALMQVIKL